MGANGKGNGKKDGAGPAPEPTGVDGEARGGRARNGKAREAAEPAEDAGPAAASSAGGGAGDAGHEGGAEREGGAPSAEASAETGGADTAEARGPDLPGHDAGHDTASGNRKGDPSPPPAHAEAPRGAAWAHPFVRFDQRWTRLEARLLTFVLVWQIAALVSWVFLRGLSASVATPIGALLRALVLGSVAGLATWRATRDKPVEARHTSTVLAVAIAIEMALLWRFLVAPGLSAGIMLGLFVLGPVAWAGSAEERRHYLRPLTVAVAVSLILLRLRFKGNEAARALDRPVYEYFDNFKGWLQEGSTLTLLGGLRGLGTRLTLWLALLGGSLATASGKHIHVDVVFRFLPRKMRLPVSILNYLFAAAVCFAGVWGFFDHIAIESYGSKADDTAGAKIANAFHHLGDHAFFTRKQIGLDLRSLPHVLAGQRYDQWMTAEAWNGWVDGAGFESRWDAAQVAALHIQEGTHPPFVVSPDGETTRSALAHTLGLVFPFGLLAIGLRFLLRALLTLSGHFAADPDEAHKEDIGGGREGAAPSQGGV